MFAAPEHNPLVVRAFLRFASATALVLGLGAANLWENWWQVDLGIDHLFEDPFALAHGEPPGRLSPATAAAFVVLGAVGTEAGSGLRQHAPRSRKNDVASVTCPQEADEAQHRPRSGRFFFARDAPVRPRR